MNNNFGTEWHSISKIVHSHLLRAIQCTDTDHPSSPQQNKITTVEVKCTAVCYQSNHSRTMLTTATPELTSESLIGLIAVQRYVNAENISIKRLRTRVERQRIDLIGYFKYRFAEKWLRNLENCIQSIYTNNQNRVFKWQPEFTCWCLMSSQHKRR